MKVNFITVRKLLQLMSEFEYNFISQEQINSVTLMDFQNSLDHIRLLRRADYVKLSFTKPDDNELQSGVYGETGIKGIVVESLNPKGQEFLENSCDEKRWKRFLKNVPDNAGLETGSHLLGSEVMRNYFYGDTAIQIATLIVASLGLVVGIIALLR